MQPHVVDFCGQCRIVQPYKGDVSDHLRCHLVLNEERFPILALCWIRIVVEAFDEIAAMKVQKGDGHPSRAPTIDMRCGGLLCGIGRRDELIMKSVLNCLIEFEDFRICWRMSGECCFEQA